MDSPPTPHEEQIKGGSGTRTRDLQHTSQSLLDRVIEVEKKADASGSRIQINAESKVVEDPSGVPFVISVLIGGWPKPPRDKVAKPDPFVPPDPDLFVQKVGTSHNLILNKFHVVKHHLLSVSDGFYPQNAWLRNVDFSSVWWVLSNFRDCMGFFNSGPVSGASQTHHHFQVIGLPFVDHEDEAQGRLVLEQTTGKKVVFSDAPCAAPAPRQPSRDLRHRPPISAMMIESAGGRLPFKHAVAYFNFSNDISSDNIGHILVGKYRQLMSKLIEELKGVRTPGDPGHGVESVDPDRPPFAYNVLLTKQWMLVVPRSSSSSSDGIKVNGLGYCGSFLVRSEGDKRTLVEKGCMQTLKECGFA